MELFYKASQRIPNDLPNTYSVFCTAVTIPYENPISLCHCTRPVLWKEPVILAPTSPLSLEVMVVHTVVLKTHCKQKALRSKWGLAWFQETCGSCPKNKSWQDSFPFFRVDTPTCSLFRPSHFFFPWSNCKVNHNNSCYFCWALTMCQVLCFLLHFHKSLRQTLLLLLPQRWGR